MSNPKVKFVQLLQSEYDSSLIHSSTTFYFCTDTQRLYVGDIMIGKQPVVTYTAGTSSDNPWLHDKSFNEIYDMLSDGIFPAVIVNGIAGYIVSFTSSQIKIGFTRPASAHPDSQREYYEFYHNASNDKCSVGTGFIFPTTV